MSPATAATLTCEEILSDLEKYSERAIVETLWRTSPPINEAFLACLAHGQAPVEIQDAAHDIHRRQQTPGDDGVPIVLDSAVPLSQLARILAQRAQHYSENWEASYAIHLDCTAYPDACDEDGFIGPTWYYTDRHAPGPWFQIDELSKDLRKALPGDSRYTDDPEVLGDSAYAVLEDSPRGEQARQQLREKGYATLLTLRIHGEQELTVEYQSTPISRAMSTDFRSVQIQTPAILQRDHLIAAVGRAQESGQWRAAQQAYEALSVQTTETLLLGAKIARAQGNINEALARLRGASDLGGSADVQAELASIEALYAPVQLEVSGRYQGDAALRPAVEPIGEEATAAILRAAQSVEETGVFIGLLPRGDYSFGPTMFHVTPGGEALTIKLQPVSDTRSISLHPRLQSGFGYGSFEGVYLEDGTGIIGFTGPAFRVALGQEVRLSDIRLLIEVGYQHSFSQFQYPELAAAISPDGAQNRMSEGFLWLAPGYGPGRLRIRLGPCIGILSGGEYGFVGEANVTDSGLYAPLSYSGSATGAMGELGWALLDSGLVELELGLTSSYQTDSVRRMLWNQLGLSLSPRSRR